MSTIKRALTSSIGQKAIVAISGLGIAVWLILHMSGNFLIFGGQDAMNSYARGLKDLGPLLWIARAGLLVLAVVHIVFTIKLTRANRKARPGGYQHGGHRQLRWAARTMIFSGLLLLAFVGYHLAHFTLFGVDPGYAQLTDPWGRHDVYRMVLTAFQSVPVAGMYIVAMALLCLHLSHGVQSVFQTLGYHPAPGSLPRRLGVGLAWILFLGFSSVPVAVQAGWVKLPGGA